MNELAGRSLRAHFASLPNPRVERTKRHQLLDIITAQGDGLWRCGPG